MIPSRVTNLAEARKLYGAKADYYVGFLTKTDPLADAVVLAFEAMPRGAGHKLLERALNHGIDSVDDAPDALRALFAQLDDIPPWVDWRRLALGARTYQRTGIAGSLVLSALSLMNGYHSSAATKPLVFTKQLDVMARRRLAETGRFIAETCQVDGLRRFSTGFKTTVKVRVIHAHVRRYLAVSDFWDTLAWGTPINQADLAATTLSFSAALLYGTRMMGWRFSAAEADALIQLWKYSGYLSGVDVGLLCSSEAEAMDLSQLIDMLQPGPDEGSIALAKALRDVNFVRAENLFEKMITPFLVRYHDGLTRATAGDQVADDLGIPNRLWKYAIPLTKLFVDPLERARERIPGATRLSSAFGNLLLRGAVEKELKGKPAEFNAPGPLPARPRPTA